MNTPTPETDALRDKLNALWPFNDFPPAQEVLDLARKLERERDEARKESDRQTEIANALTDYCGMEKQAILEMVELKQERDQLRKVCDDLALRCYKQCKDGVGIDCLKEYNNLPHRQKSWSPPNK